MDKNKGMVIWLAVAAGLLGAAQQVLIVLLPIMSDRFNITYGSLINIQALGSFIFLFSTPYWAKKSDSLTTSVILKRGTIGYIFSFILIVCSWLLIDFDLINSTLYLIIFLVSRLIYGWFASAIVPQVQNWSLMLKANSSIAALARVNLGGTLARMLSPIIATVLLFVHPIFALFLPLLLATCVCIKLLGQSVFFEGRRQERSDQTIENKPDKLSLPRSSIPLLVMAFLTSLCLALSMFALAPLALSRFTLSSEQTAEFVAYALTFSAILTTIGQVYFSRTKSLKTSLLLRVGVAIAFISALIINQSHYQVVVIIAMAFLSLGCNWMTLSYTAKLVQSKNRKVTSWVSMLHTLGYGSAALVFNIFSTQLYLIIAILVVIGFITVWLGEKLINSRDLLIQKS